MCLRIKHTRACELAHMHAGITLYDVCMHIMILCIHIIYIHTCMHACMHTHTHTHTCMHACMCVYEHKCKCTCKGASVGVSVKTCYLARPPSRRGRQPAQPRQGKGWKGGLNNLASAGGSHSTTLMLHHKSHKRQLQTQQDDLQQEQMVQMIPEAHDSKTGCFCSVV